MDALAELICLLYCFICSYSMINTNAISSTNLTVRKAIEADRVYYIAAMEIYWDYAPNASNPFTGIPVDEDEEASVYTSTNNIDRIGSVYKKALYREFTDDTFTTLKERDADWLHLGVLGPPVRGIIGERIKIIFFNNCTQNYSMHPHGLAYTKTSEGATYKGTYQNAINSLKSVDYNGGQHVKPGEQWVYIWDIREEFNYLSSNEFTSKLWWYHSHINEPMDTNSGLVGPIIVTKKGKETSTDNPQPKDVDREFVTLFTVFDENLSWYLTHNLRRKIDLKLLNHSSIKDYLKEFDFEDDEFMESNLMHSMNGLSWNALGKYHKNNIKIGEKIRWYIGAMGTEVDLHTAHWHGNIIINDNFIMKDVIQLMPSYSTEVDMVTDNAGEWFYHCHVNDHVEAGMIATYTVINETCYDCNGYMNSYFVDDDDNDNVYDSFLDIVGDHDTWFIVIISNVITLMIVLCICILYSLKNKKRKKQNNKVKQQYGVTMSNVGYEPMLDDNNKV